MFLINKFNLNNLTIIIDRNFSRNEAIPLGNIKKKFQVFQKIFKVLMATIIVKFILH